MIEKVVKGIVLEKFEFEDEHIVKIITEGGNVLSLKAKGIDNIISKNRSSLNTFNKVEVEYFTSPVSTGNTGRLKRSTIISEMTKINDSILNIFQVVNNLILNNEKNDKQTYHILDKIISAFVNNNFNFQNILELMVLVLRQNNYYPEVRSCVVCGTRQNIDGFSLYEGGLLCLEHNENRKYKLAPSTLKKIIFLNSLNNLLELNSLEFDNGEIQKIRDMYKLFLENQLGFNLYYINRI